MHLVSQVWMRCDLTAMARAGNVSVGDSPNMLIVVFGGWYQCPHQMVKAIESVYLLWRGLRPQWSPSGGF